LRARVAKVTFYGHDATVMLTVADDAGSLQLTARVAGHMTPRVGEEVGLSVEGKVIAFADDGEADNH
jgi:iron(III) transport system ATP-binding protein